MATAFSYAQAAKRQLSNPPPAPQSVTSQAASTASSQSRDATTATSSVAPSTSSNEQDVNDTTPQPTAALDSVGKSESAATEPHQSNDDESAQKSAAAESPALPSQDKKQPGDASTAAERRPKAPLASSRAADPSDSRKARKGKKPRGSDKESEQEQTSDKEKEPEAPKPQLVEATIPAVNFWVQRAKDAQTKTVPSTPARSVTGASATSMDSKSKSSLNESAESGATQKAVPAAKGQKKDSARDGSDQASRRTAPRGSRVGDKTAEPMPAVTDAASWPTPETAATETKTVETVAPKQPEAEDAQDEKQSAGPKEKTKWVPVPHVPTVNFNTPLPTRTPRGGRTGGSRGGRDAGARAGHAGASASADRAQAARPATDRPGEAGRTSTAPHPAKRTSVDANRDARKASGAGKDAAKISSQPINGADETPKAAQADSADASSQQQATSDAPASSEKRADSGSRQPDATKESSGTAGRESGHHGAPRSERRGGQRGRGGHANTNGQGHHAHGSYAANGQQFPLPGNMSGRQNSYPGNIPSVGYGMPGAAPSGHRGAGQRNSTSGAYFGRNGRNGRGPSVPNTQNFQPMDPAQYPMSAVPQQQFFYEQTMMGMLVRQLSYYFSVNNLLKDSWLRKWMDSQGYVFLDIILGFQRMKDLTQDISFVRAACIECPDIELVTSVEDQRDRVRRVEGWQKFVYPKGQRHEAVNHDDGPANVYKYDNSHNGWVNHWPPMVPPYQMDSPGHFSPNGTAFPPYVAESMQQYSLSNGVNGHAAGETQLSAEVPEFSPKGGSSASEGEQNAAAVAPAQGESAVPVNGTSEAFTNGAATAEVAGH